MATRSGMDNLLNPQNISPGQINLAVYNSVRYLSDTTNMEAELSAVYSEASSVVQRILNLPDAASDTSLALSAN